LSDEDKTSHRVHPGLLFNPQLTVTLVNSMLVNEITPAGFDNVDFDPAAVYPVSILFPFRALILK
jgi:hypothetical protein